MSKGRRKRAVETLNYLSEVLNLTGVAFARKLGKQASNVSNYMSGKSEPGILFFRSALRHAFEWEVTPIVEVRTLKTHFRGLPKTPGVYCLYDSSGSVIYAGQATSLKAEIAQALNRRMNFPVRLGPKLSKKTHPRYSEVATHFSAYEVRSARLRHNLEALLLRTFPNQSHNNKLGRFR